MLSGRDIRKKFADHLFGLSSSFFDKRRIGELMSLATNDVDAIRMALGPGLLTLADALFYFLTVPVAMYWLSPKLTLIAFIPLPLIPLFVMRNEKEIHKRFDQVQASFGKISSLAQENLNGIRVIKAFAREDAQLERFKRAGEDHIRHSLWLARVQSAFGPMLDFFMSLGLVLLLYFGGQSVIEKTVTLGTFVAFQRYIQKMVWPMTALGLSITYYQRGIASSNRIQEVLSVKSDIEESLTPVLPADYRVGTFAAPWKTRGEIEFKNLSFRFAGAERESLSGLSLKIKAGERIAFIGGIGSGKSALLGLIPRLYPVGRGMLFIDGVDVNDWPIDELRRQVGYVSQEVFLFSDSVIENVAYGLSDLHDSSPAHLLKSSIVEASTRLASVHEDMLGLREGYQTVLGERGVNLSGGQKQRLTIARALAKQPSILVLDDALSSVDVQTEERILTSLRSRGARNTEIIAAHRISTIKDADRIVVLDRGRIDQLGSHEELLKDRAGLYFNFYEQQRLKEDLEEFLHVLDERVDSTQDRTSS